MKKLFFGLLFLVVSGAFGQAPTLADLRSGNVKLQTRVKQGTAYMLEPTVLAEYIKEQASVSIVPPDTNYIFDAYGNGRFKGIMKSKYSFADSAVANVIVDVVNGSDTWPETAYPTASFQSLTKCFQWIAKASSHQFNITIKNTSAGLKAVLNQSSILIISGKYIQFSNTNANGAQYIELSGSLLVLSNSVLTITGGTTANFIVDVTGTIPTTGQIAILNAMFQAAFTTFNLPSGSTNGLFNCAYSSISITSCTTNFTANNQALFARSRGCVIDIGQTANTWNMGAYTGLKLSNEHGGGRCIALISPVQAIPAGLAMGTSYVIQEGKAATPFLTYAQRVALTNPYPGITVAQSDSLQGEYYYNGGWKLKTAFGQSISVTANNTGGGSASVTGDSRRGLITVSLGGSTVAEGVTIATLNMPTVNSARQVVLQDVNDNVLVDGSSNQMTGGFRLEPDASGKFFALKVKSVSPGTWTTVPSGTLKFSYIVQE